MGKTDEEIKAEIEVTADEEPTEVEVDVTEGEEPVDYAAMEGDGKPPEKKDEKKEHMPKEGSLRYNQIYGKMKELERTLEDVQQHGVETSPIFKQLATDNKKLLDAVRQQTEAVKESVPQPADTRASDVERINGEISQLKSDRKEARGLFDNDKADDISDKIHDLQSELDKVKTAPKEEKPSVVDQDAIDQFTESSPWYDPNNEAFDETMADAAEALDSRLRKHPEWVNRPVLDRLVEVQDRIEKKFQWYVEGETPDWLDTGEEKPKDGDEGNGAKPPAKPRKAAVEGGGGGKPKATPGKVHLNAEQVHVAKMMGMSLEDYAKGMTMGRDLDVGW